MRIQKFALFITLSLHFPLVAQTLEIAIGHSNQGFKAVLQQFALQEKVTVNSRFVDNSELKLELLTRAKSGNQPDAVIVPNDFIGIEDIRFQPISQSWLNSKLDVKALNMGRVGEDQLGIPIVAGNHLLMFYNKNLVTQPAKTWDEITQNKTKHSIGWSYNEAYWIAPFLNAFDAFPLQNAEVIFKPTQLKAAFTFYVSLQKNQTIDSSCNYNCSNLKFKNGQLSYFISGYWSYAELLESLGDKLGVASLPKIENTSLQPFFSVHVLAFPKKSTTSEKKALLARLSLFLQQKQVQEELLNKYQLLPVHNEAFVKDISQLTENFSVVLTELEQAKPLPSHKYMPVLWAVLSKGLNRYASGIYDVDQSIEYMRHITERSLQLENDNE